DPAGTEEHDIVCSLDEGQCRQFLNLRTRSAACEGEVIILDGLDRRQCCDLHECGTLTFDASVILHAQETFQEVAMSRIISSTLLGHGGPLAGDPFQRQDIT